MEHPVHPTIFLRFRAMLPGMDVGHLRDLQQQLKVAKKQEASRNLR